MISRFRQFAMVAAMLCLAQRGQRVVAQSQGPAGPPGEIRIVELQGKVEVLPAGTATWVLTQTNQALYPSWRLRSGENSRFALMWPGQSTVRFGALTEIEILPPHEPAARPGLQVFRGIMSFFHRDKPGRLRVVTAGAVAGIEGTEFVLAHELTNGIERTTLSLIDGKVQL